MRIAAACALVLAACELYFGPSHDHATGPDAQPSCGGPNDPAPIVATGAPGSIAVHVDPAANVGVIVRDADGTRAVTPDAQGDATVSIRPPAIVTGATSAYVESITGVEPGDALCLACPAAQATPIRTRITAPARSDAAAYSFANGEVIQYNAPGPSTSLSASQDGPHDVMAVATDAGGNVLGWSAAPTQTLTDGETIALGAWQAPVTFTASYDHVPDTAQVVIDRSEQSSAGALPAFAFTKGQGGATVTQPASDSGAALMAVDSELYVITGTEVSSEAMFETVPASLAYHVDLDQALLPWMSALAYDGCTHELTWTERGGGAAADGVWIEISSDTREWSVLVPPGATHVDFDDLTAQLVPPGAVTGIFLESYDVDAITSYAQMRAWNPATLAPGAGAHRQGGASVSYSSSVSGGTVPGRGRRPARSSSL